METIIIILLIALAMAIPISMHIKKNKDNNSQKTIVRNNCIYHKRTFLTKNEKFFLDKLKKIFNDKYIIQPQIPLRMLVTKDGEEYGQYANELNRYIDIGIFDKNYEILALIELNDKSHKEYERYKRDLKVQDICKQAKIPLITFWTYGNQTEENIKYIIEKEINNERTINQSTK